jgi:hypothetical protein
MSLPYIEPPRATHAAPRRVRLPWRSSARPVFSWRHVRAPWDSRWLVWQLFLLCWVLMCVYFGWWAMTGRVGPNAGLRLPVHEMTDLDYQRQALRHITSWGFEPGMCQEKALDASKYPELVCLEVHPGWRLVAFGQEISPDDVFPVLARAGSSVPTLHVVIRADPKADYEEVAFVLEQVLRYRELRGSPCVCLVLGREVEPFFGVRPQW